MTFNPNLKNLVQMSLLMELEGSEEEINIFVVKGSVHTKILILSCSFKEDILTSIVFFFIL